MAFKVIDGGGSGRENRELQEQREWVKLAFSKAVRDMAANMLCVISGAGKSHELLVQMKNVIDQAIEFQELHGHFPEISNFLMIQNEHQKHIDRARAGELDQASVDRWWKDGTFEQMMAEHKIMCGALQAVASQLIAQETQNISGERELHDGIKLDEGPR